MKIVLPLIICSAIFAALGYYFGHITLPADSGKVTSAPATTSTENPPPEPEIVMVEREAEPDPMPVETEPEAEPEAEPEPEPEPEPEAEPTPSEETTTPAATEKSLAERAASTMQTLTDTQGRTIEASIVKVTDTGVRVRMNNGRETTISLDLLSEEDVAFCNYLREQQKKEQEAKPPVDEDGFDWDSYFNS